MGDRPKGNDNHALNWLISVTPSYNVRIFEVDTREKVTGALGRVKVVGSISE